MPTSEELLAVMDVYPRLNYFTELSEGLSTFLNNSSFTDVEIIVDGCTFPCHRIVLASMSHYFKTMFTSNFKESELNKVEIQGLDKITFKTVLSYMYSGETPVDNANVYQLLNASSMLQIRGLQSVCDEFLRKSLKPSNCIGIWKLARGHGLKELQKISWQLIQKSFPDVSQTEEYLHADKEEIIEIISSQDLFTRTEEFVCEAVLKWVRADKNRRKNLQDIFQSLRLTQMSLDFLCNVRDCEEIEDCPGCRTLILEAIDKLNSMSPKDFVAESMFRQEEVLCIVGTRSREPNPQKVEVLCYSFRHDKKFKFSTLPVEPGPCFAVCSLDRDIFISGGYNQQQLLLHFSPVTNSWIENNKMINGRWGHAMVSVGQFLYLVAGMSKTNETLSSIERYDPATQTFEQIGDLQVPVSSTTAAVMGDKILVFGGKLKDRTAGTVIQYFDLASATSGIIGNLPEECAGSVGRVVEHNSKLVIVFRDGTIIEYSEEDGVDVACKIDSFDHFGAVMHEEEVLILGNRSGTCKFIIFNLVTRSSREMPVPFKIPMCNFYCLKTVVSKKYLIH